MVETAPARAAAILAAAAMAGAGTMTVELAAVRMLAPWFRTSLVVWTNVIGVILLALALGYLVGGRLSAGPAPARRLGVLLLAAAAATAWLPWLAGAVAGWLLPDGLTLDDYRAKAAGPDRVGQAPEWQFFRQHRIPQHAPAGSYKAR